MQISSMVFGSEDSSSSCKEGLKLQSQQQYCLKIGSRSFSFFLIEGRWPHGIKLSPFLILINKVIGHIISILYMLIIISNIDIFISSFILDVFASYLLYESFQSSSYNQQQKCIQISRLKILFGLKDFTTMQEQKKLTNLHGANLQPKAIHPENWSEATTKMNHREKLHQFRDSLVSNAGHPNSSNNSYGTPDGSVQTMNDQPINFEGSYPGQNNISQSRQHQQIQIKNKKLSNPIIMPEEIGQGCLFGIQNLLPDTQMNMHRETHRSDQNPKIASKQYKDKSQISAPPFERVPKAEQSQTKEQKLSQKYKQLEQQNFQLRQQINRLIKEQGWIKKQNEGIKNEKQKVENEKNEISMKFGELQKQVSKQKDKIIDLQEEKLKMFENKFQMQIRINELQQSLRRQQQKNLKLSVELSNQIGSIKLMEQSQQAKYSNQNQQQRQEVAKERTFDKKKKMEIYKGMGTNIPTLLQNINLNIRPTEIKKKSVWQEQHSDSQLSHQDKKPIAQSKMHKL